MNVWRANDLRSQQQVLIVTVSRPRPYASQVRRRKATEEVAHPVADDATATFRPLLSAAAASGLMTIGVLQFMGDIWSDLPSLARQYITMAVQGAFIGFIFQLAAVVLALAAQRRSDKRLPGLLNIYGIATLIAGVFVTGTLVSRALTMAQPMTVEPADSVALFSAIGFFGLVGIAVTALVGWVVGLVRQLTTGGRA